MRTAAVALVLIVGAAVVLWFGNMVNSWVLGGLIGGLAALLLSIPITLTLFSFLSRRHDQRYGTIEPEVEEMTLAQAYGYGDGEEESYTEVMEADVYEYELPPERYEDRGSRRIPASRNLPTSTYPRLPAAGQSHASASYDSTLHRRESMQLPRQQTKIPPAVSGNGVSSLRSSPDRRTYNAGSQGRVTRSLHQSAALHAARKEAVQQQNDVEVLPNTMYNLKRIPADRPVRGRTSRQLSQQREYQKRRVVVDATSDQSGTRRQAGGPRTEPVNRSGRYSQTGPVRKEMQTDQLTRDQQWVEEDYDPEMSTGSLRNPLVRRAPYMYEDDTLRQELSRQVERPIKRRSSRYEEEE